jgi:5-dehydro-2-deoxygluconokinase
MVEAIEQIQDAGVEPTIWKLEGVEKADDAKAVVKAAQRNSRKAGVITLGRGESKEKVQEWLKVGAQIPGIIGFAVGRTIFWEPLAEHKAGKLDKQAAIEGVARNYADFAKLWMNERMAK